MSFLIGMIIGAILVYFYHEKIDSFIKDLTNK